jgi:hypothetical protein
VATKAKPDQTGSNSTKKALVALAGAFAAGLAVAKLLEWRAFVELGKAE